MSPLYLAQFLELHAVQQAAYQELIMWGNSGTQGIGPTDMAIERALAWAKQVPIPPPAIVQEEDES